MSRSRRLSSGGGTLFVDESKAREYILVAVLVPISAQPHARQAVRSLIMPGQRRLHMKDESPPRKREILSTLGALGLQSHVYDAGRCGRGPGGRSQLQQRADCLRALLKDAEALEARHVVLELDATLESWDRQTLIEETRALSMHDLRYEHLGASQEQLLALPDAVAWAVAKGGEWKARVRGTIGATRLV